MHQDSFLVWTSHAEWDVSTLGLVVVYFSWGSLELLAEDFTSSLIIPFPQLLSNGSRYLIRSDDMVETVYNERGEIIKTKERRLFLLNDVLMCATPNIR